MHIGAGDDFAVVGECFVIALDGREAEEVVDHEVSAPSETLLAGVAPVPLASIR